MWSQIAYAALSERTNVNLLQEWSHLTNYKIVSFEASDHNQLPVYHTNVILAIGSTVAIVCLDSIVHLPTRLIVRESLCRGREIVEISVEQMKAFCGNVLEVRTNQDRPVLVMSSQAFKAFTKSQKDRLTRHFSKLIHSDFTTIETVGGGGVRCAMAELF